jgi:hypothetical protein
MNFILNSLPLAVPEKRIALEYEIQMLRIVSVGWAIAFFLADDGLKKTPNLANNSGNMSGPFPPPFPPRHH